MAAFFQDLGKKITSAAQDASKKTSELIEVSKLNSSISAEKNVIADTEKKIGAAVYALFAAGEPIPEVLMADVQAIFVKYQNIAELENKIAEIKAESEKVKAEASAAAATPVQPAAAAPVQPAAGAARFCSACGAQLESGMVFCGKCGHKNE